MKKKITVFEVICYVAAALLAIVAVYLLYANIAYLNEYLAAYGMTMADLGGQAAQTLITACVPYFAYAFLALAAGRIYHAVAAPVCECVCEEPVLAEEAAVAEVEQAVEEAVAAEPVCECACACEEEAVVEQEPTVVLAETPASVDATEAVEEEEK